MTKDLRENIASDCKNANQDVKRTVLILANMK